MEIRKELRDLSAFLGQYVYLPSHPFVLKSRVHWATHYRVSLFRNGTPGLFQISSCFNSQVERTQVLLPSRLFHYK